MSTLNSGPEIISHDGNCINVGDSPYVIVQISSFESKGGEVQSVQLGMRFGNGVHDMESARGLLVMALNSDVGNLDDKGNGNDNG